MGGEDYLKDSRGGENILRFQREGVRCIIVVDHFIVYVYFYRSEASSTGRKSNSTCRVFYRVIDGVRDFVGEAASRAGCAWVNDSRHLEVDEFKRC